MKYFGGIMGVMQYILPIGTFAIAIKLAVDEGEELKGKLIQYGIAIISLAIVFSVFQISAGELQSSKELSELVKDAYYVGSQGKGGGANPQYPGSNNHPKQHGKNGGSQKKYDDIENQNLSTADIKNFLDKTKNMVGKVNDVFKQQLENLYQTEIVDTDAEMKVFNSMLQSDGFGSASVEIPTNKVESEGK